MFFFAVHTSRNPIFFNLYAIQIGQNRIWGCSVNMASILWFPIFGSFDHTPGVDGVRILYGSHHRAEVQLSSRQSVAEVKGVSNLLWLRGTQTDAHVHLPACIENSCQTNWLYV